MDAMKENVSHLFLYMSFDKNENHKLLLFKHYKL